jgi:hypothetical protein
LSAGCLALCGTAVLRGWRDTGMWHLQPRGHETTLDKRYQQRFEVDIAQRSECAPKSLDRVSDIFRGTDRSIFE